MNKIRKSGALSVFLTKDYTSILPFISSAVLALAFLSREFYLAAIVGLIPLIIFCLRAGQYSTKQKIVPEVPYLDLVSRIWVNKEMIGQI